MVYKKKDFFKRRSNNFLKILKVIVLSSFCILLLFIGRISLFKTFANEDLMEFQRNRNIVNSTLYAERGKIFDTNGNIIAQTLLKYNIYAILDEKYSLNQKPNEKKLHVVEPERASKEISPIIGMQEEEFLKILKKDKFQVEFAPYGNSISQEQKEKIESLNLEGIYFTSHESRSYPQGPFASHIVGYASYNQLTRHLEGAMGIEELFNDKWLKGTDGFHKFYANIHGQKLKDSPEIYLPEKKGSNIFLTIDAHIQQQIESKLIEVAQKHNPKWAIIAIADPKSGAILGVGQTPTFDPNIKNIKDYNNYFTKIEYEVGSIMKPITFASAIETGKYNAEKLVNTGSVNIDGCTISDWNGSGWGSIPVDKGLFYSSNTIIYDIVSNTLTKEEQKDFLKKFGFGKPTGLEVDSESFGYLSLDNLLSRVTTGYGQGSTATAAQMLQAYCAIANKGLMKQLHFIDKIEDNLGNLEYKHTPVDICKSVSEQTATHVLNLLDESVNHPSAYSRRFKISSGSMAGKTGTANVTDEKNGGYLPAKDHRNYIYSFAGIAPINDPKFVALISISQPQIDPNGATETAAYDLLNNINTYLNIDRNYNKCEIAKNLFPSFINTTVSDISKILAKNGIKEENCIILGDGDIIIDQNISPYSNNVNQRILLKTNVDNIKIPNFSNWLRKDIQDFSKLTGIKINIEGLGYCVAQSIPPGTFIEDKEATINIRLSI